MQKVIKKIQDLADDKEARNDLLLLVKQEIDDRIKRSTLLDSSKCIYIVLKDCCFDLDSKLELIQQTFEILKHQPEVLFDEIEGVLKQFEVEDSIQAMVMQTKLRKIINGDNFKLQKEFIIELEQASNSNAADHPNMCAEAKALIVESMFAQGQGTIAVNYLKKNLIKYGGTSGQFEKTFISCVNDLQVDMEIISQDKFLRNILEQQNDSLIN